jgi:hypothetical protein
MMVAFKAQAIKIQTPVNSQPTKKNQSARIIKGTSLERPVFVDIMFSAIVIYLIHMIKQSPEST